jgi:hypothetical protein
MFGVAIGRGLPSICDYAFGFDYCSTKKCPDCHESVSQEHARSWPLNVPRNTVCVLIKKTKEKKNQKKKIKKREKDADPISSLKFVSSCTFTRNCRTIFELRKK